MDNQNADFKDGTVVSGEQQWLRHYRSFIHNIAAAETWVRSTLPPWWTHETFAVIGSSDGSEGAGHRGRVCIKIKQATQTPDGSVVLHREYESEFL